jgi:zinc transporter
MSADGLIHAFVLDGKGGAHALDWAGIDAWKPGDGVLWINFDYASAPVADWLRTKSALDPIVISALTDFDPRPRAVAHGEDLLLVVRGINNNAGASPEDMISVRAWISRDRVITLRHRPSSSIRQLVTALEASAGPRDAGELTLGLVDTMNDHVALRIDRFGDDVAACEDKVLTGDTGDLRATLAEHRRHAIAMRRFLAPQRDALNRLASINVPWLGPTHRAHLTEIADQLIRTVEELDAARDRAAVTQEELGSRVAEAANQRLYVLSIITAFFLPLGFVCSLLGVNVGGVPLQKDDWAFWALCGLFAIYVAVQLWFFRRRRWL